LFSRAKNERSSPDAAAALLSAVSRVIGFWRNALSLKWQRPIYAKTLPWLMTRSTQNSDQINK
jgi:hypothetical protein